MFNLAHISDIHLGPMPRISWRDLMSKRITGYINWQRNRAAEFSPIILNTLAAHMNSANPDHIVITGDLVNLSLSEEIERATRWLNSLSDGQRLTIICGNHDAYIKGMLEQAMSSWQEYLVGDNGIPVTSNASFPVVRHRGPCALILVNTALPTKPFDATGVFDQIQAEKLERVLLQEQKKCRVVLIHHPPISGATKRANRLIGDDLFREVLYKTGADLVLHGHTHLDTLNWIAGPKFRIPVVCVPAGGQAVGGKKPAAQYNWFGIEAKGGRWTVEQTKMGYSARASGVVKLDQIKLS